MALITELERLAQMYKDTKAMAEKTMARADEIKKELIEKVQKEGYTDEKGHQWLDAGSFQLKRERRASVSFNESEAEAWARDTNKWDEVKEVREFVSEDKFLAVVWDNPELKEELDKFYTTRESYAFKVVEGKSYEDE